MYLWNLLFKIKKWKEKELSPTIFDVIIHRAVSNIQIGILVKKR